MSRLGLARHPSTLAGLDTQKKNLLVYRALHLGDFLTGVPAYRAIARAFPHHRRFLVAPRSLVSLARRCNAFHGLIDTTAERLEPLPYLGSVDIAVDLHGRGPECHRVVLDTNPAHFIGFKNIAVPASYAGPQWVAEEHEVHRWCRMLNEHSIAADPADLLLPKPPPLEHLRGVTVIHPGAASFGRRWPSDRWAAIARALYASGHRVVITGVASERELAIDVACRAELPHTCILAGKTSLESLTSIVAHARVVYSGDTGIAHLAFAFATPTVTLYGPINPDDWGPPKRSVHRTIWHGRVGDPHAVELDPSLAAITVEEVLALSHE